MGSYSMTLKEVIDMITHTQTLNARDTIEKGRKKLFDFDYPFFDSSYKNVFETNFIRNFYMTEIGFETEGLFKFRLETWLLINMPYFNKLFESELIDFNPLYNVDVKDVDNKTKNRNQQDNRTTNQTANTSGTSDSNTTQNSTNVGTSNQTVNSDATDDNFNRNIESDTPDGRLNLTANDGEGVIEYASKIKENNENNQRNENHTTNSSSDSEINEQATNQTTANTDSIANQNDQYDSEITETEDYLRSKIGKVGGESYSKMLMEYRETFLRIEKQIFSEMRKELFSLVY